MSNTYFIFFLSIQLKKKIQKSFTRLAAKVEERRQPWTIFQFLFFLGELTIKNQKTNMVALQFNSLALF